MSAALVRTRQAALTARSGVRSYSASLQPQRPHHHTGRRIVLGSFGLVGSFYGISAYASTKSDRYADFFATNIPHGRRVVKFAETHSLSDISDSAESFSKTAHSIYAKGKSLMDYLRGEGVKGDKDAIVLFPSKVKTSIAPEQFVAKGDLRVEATNDTVVKGEVEKHAATLASQAVDTAADAVSSLGVSTNKPPSREAESATRLVAHNPSLSDRPLMPDKSTVGTLRAPPAGIKLPSLSTRVGSSPAEPVIREFASTIDELAAVVAATPSGAAGSTRAAGALRAAESDLQKLSARVDEIKAAEEKRLGDEINSLRLKYKAELQAQADKAVRQAGESETAWEARMASQFKQLQAQAEEKWRVELTSQAALIRERLYNEVVAQGVSLQKRWFEELGQKIEQERGGRLARLEELTKQVSTLQDAAAIEAKAHDDALWLQKLRKATQAFELVSLTSSEGDGAPRTFRQELQALENAVSGNITPDVKAFATETSLLFLSLNWLRNQKAPDTGVVSGPSLSAWFVDRVAPALLGVALVPSEAGPIMHATSAVLGPLLAYNPAFARNNKTAAAVNVAKEALGRNQLATATAALSGLEGWSALIARDWLAAARVRLEVQQAIDTVKTEAQYESLLLA